MPEAVEMACWAGPPNKEAFSKSIATPFGLIGPQSLPTLRYVLTQTTWAEENSSRMHSGQWRRLPVWGNTEAHFRWRTTGSKEVPQIQSPLLEIYEIAFSLTAAPSSSCLSCSPCTQTAIQRSG
ncbi:uncharacterized protein MYCFIDRAFT_163165 [Pseudocercospora fijiensis CIRAD86]|uniref:Uncharacterized protein n=1 Tax=Pseudocercospora fijiensis (strain CIRAD86) TaxID=383855 RepID=M2Z3F7_PSEFD|nr:uncharacterized protein MYCFIDRAFT_163165 [Pseudocercospora fijiensis CIRAD86]EME84365.1 hypothetical protein MYCFIDRAFT_163165 [Pseudocercospora fijiensis CIRAD86]